MNKGFLLTVVAMSGFAAFGQDVPKIEVPVGFSFVNVHPDFSQITSFNLFGGGGAFNVNFGRYWGVKADFMGYTQSSSLTTKLHELGYTGNVSGNVFTYMFGPQIKKHTGVFQPFGEVLVGAAHSNLYATLYDASNGTTNASSNNNAFAFATGGGIDLKLTRHISARPVQVDYLLTRFGVNGTGYTGSQNNFRYFAGINFTFGGAPPIPPTASCTVQPTEIMAGDPVTATISTQNFNPRHTVTYSWSSTGGSASGTGTTANLSTANLSPGSYTVTGTATDERQRTNNTASCSASFTVKAPRPPIASCSADPTTVQPGASAIVTVNASSPDGRSLTYSYSATAGSVTGTGSTGTLNTAGAAAGSPITVTANVVDDRGLSAQCTAAVNVLAPPVTVVESQEVGTCNFNDPRKTARVDNVCKAVLDEVALRLQREPNGRVVVVGYAEEEEIAKVSDIDGQRSVNVKYYLTSGESQAQIDPSRIEVRKGAHGSRTATIHFVPEGATFNGEGTQTVDESATKGQSRKAPATRRAKKTAATPPPQ